eukprot:gene153-6139_t
MTIVEEAAQRGGSGVEHKYAGQGARNARFATFAAWPHPLTPTLSPETLAAAGFEHTPSAKRPDRCTCVSCGYSLVGWEGADVPWHEHSRHMPDCPYVVFRRAQFAWHGGGGEGVWFSAGEGPGKGGREPPPTPQPLSGGDRLRVAVLL